MEITNDNYRILHKKSLKIGDIVYFKYNHKVYKYEVKEKYLYNTKGYNDEILIELKLNKYSAASKAYGYPGGDGAWPEYNNQDYQALTRFVIFLFEEIEKRENPKTSVESISNNPMKIKITIEPQIKIKLK